LEAIESRLDGVTFVKGESDFLHDPKLIIMPNPIILFDMMFFIPESLENKNKYYINVKFRSTTIKMIKRILFIILFSLMKIFTLNPFISMK